MTTILPGYDIRKAAQVAAYFALRQGGAINVLKLSKLLYLAEREYMARFDEPMFFDNLVSMPDGPVASVTLNLINGDYEDRLWREFVQPRTSYDIRVVNGRDMESLDELSRADLSVLEGLWDQFGAYDRYALRDWTHRPENIPEWVDPLGSSRPITHEDVFNYLNKPSPAMLAAEVEERRHLSEQLAAE
jgi:uncharacterized phage-associated protein